MTPSRFSSTSTSPLRLALALLLATGLAACGVAPTPSGAAPAGPIASDHAPAGISAAPTIGAQALQPKTAPLTTPWTNQVSTTAPLPEYPRPQLVRPNWLNLNGQWQFSNAAAGEAPPINRVLPETVLVPYPIESALSGIQRHQDRMWYRRTFSVPTGAGWKNKNIQLNFGAVDYQATVYVNGQLLGTHSGGYDAFSYDITPQLKNGTNEIIVGVFDPTNSGDQPQGKQVNVPDSGIFYTASSGIWQSVWLEPTSDAHITRLDMTPDVPGGALRLTVQGEGITGESVSVQASVNGAPIGKAVKGVPGRELRIPVPSARLWTPDDPFLYDLKVTLKAGTTNIDTAGSYFGMRSVGLKTVNNVLRPVLNGKFVFQLGTLDQGFWPDGLHTAPTDDALKSDILRHKELGFNTIRKHIKVEPQRWFYWADKLGVMVWQDMPSMPPGRNPTQAARVEFEKELRIMIDQHRSSPAIVTWVPFNEGWGEYDPARIADVVKAQDPSRLVNNMSGFNCCGYDGGNGDLIDYHIYVGPGVPPPSTGRAQVIGEFGGLGLKVPGHQWNPNRSFSYELQPDAATLTRRYLGLVSSVKGNMINLGLSAAIYTEITDVESEVNGLLTYDRQVLKVDGSKVRAAQQDLIASSNDLPPPPPALPVGDYVSLQVTTPNFDTRFLRHAGGLSFTEVVNDTSDAGLKADATFKLVPGLADAECISFQARNFPNRYLRHADSRVRLDENDGSPTLASDATWCPRSGLSGHDVSFESKNFPGRYLRHFAAEGWLAENGGPRPSDGATSFAEDTTWKIAAPWAP